MHIGSFFQAHCPLAMVYRTSGRMQTSADRRWTNSPILSMRIEKRRFGIGHAFIERTKTGSSSKYGSLGKQGAEFDVWRWPTLLILDILWRESIDSWRWDLIRTFRIDGRSIGSMSIFFIHLGKYFVNTLMVFAKVWLGHNIWYDESGGSVWLRA